MKNKVVEVLQERRENSMKRQKPKYNSLLEYISSVERGKELFDLKEQFDEECWRKHLEKLYTGEESSHRRDKSFYKKTMDELEAINNNSALINFLAYKGLPEYCDFDCDGTVSGDYYKQGYYSWFMREIYRSLWNWQDLCGTDEEEFKNIPIKKFAKSCFENIDMGPDTMNSFWTTFCAYLISFLGDTYQWNKYKNTFLFNDGENEGQRQRALRLKHNIENQSEDRINNENINTFAQLTHTMGNMVLVPAGYNGYRGTKNYLKDYFDLSLDNLLHSWDYNNYFGKEDAMRQSKFSEYVNVFFLWDYVDYAYNVSPLCNSHREKMQKRTLNDELVLPEKNEIDYLCSEVNQRIKRRCLFMCAMLKIASGMSLDGKSEYEYCGKYQSEWKEWIVSGIYKEFMERIFMKDEIYAGYGEVIDRMKEVADEIVQKDLDRKWIGSIIDGLSDLRKDIL